MLIKTLAIIAFVQSTIQWIVVILIYKLGQKKKREINNSIKAQIKKSTKKW